MQGYPRANAAATHSDAVLRSTTNQEDRPALTAPRAVVKRLERAHSSSSSDGFWLEAAAHMEAAAIDAKAKRSRTADEPAAPAATAAVAGGAVAAAVESPPFDEFWLAAAAEADAVAADAEAKRAIVAAVADAAVPVASPQRAAPPPPSVSVGDTAMPSIVPDEETPYLLDFTQPALPLPAPPPTGPPSGLHAWGLPEPMVRAYVNKGVTSLYAWQVECLQQDGVLDGARHLVYAAPTSGGKTMVAELLMLRRVLERPRFNKAMFIVPIAALAEQKTQSLAALFEAAASPLEAEGYFRDRGSRFLPDAHPGPGGGSGGSDVAVCTIEKAHHLLNRMVERKCVDRLRVVVIDEAHMIGDGARGALLEAIVSKLLYLRLDLQIVCMSATLPNLSVFGQWFGAVIYQTTFRPVALVEHLVCLPPPTNGRNARPQPISVQRVELNADGQRVVRDEPVRTFAVPSTKVTRDTRHVLELWPLVLEVLMQRKSVLVFASSRDFCQNVARFLAELVAENRNDLVDMLMDPKVEALREEALHELLHCVGGSSLALNEMARYGVAFHHAGLTADERQVVERYYSAGALRVLVATSSLAVGVNLPAARVIFRDHRMGTDSTLSSTHYQQMAGRAGRAGLDALGEVYVLAEPKDVPSVRRMMVGPSPLMRSSMGVLFEARAVALPDKPAPPLAQQQPVPLQGPQQEMLTRLLIDVIGHGLVQSRAQLVQFKESTLFWRELDAESDGGVRAQLQERVDAAFEEAVRQLREKKYFEFRADGSIQLSPRAVAISATWYTPEMAQMLMDLVRDVGSRGMVLFGTDLHVAYLFVPLMRGALVDRPHGEGGGPMRTSAMKLKLRPEEQRVFELVFPEEWIPAKEAVNKLPKAVALRVDRFFNALLINEMLRSETPLPRQVATRFGLATSDSGKVQHLLDACHESAGQLVAFCELLGPEYKKIAGAVQAFLPRLEQGVSSELLPLIALPKMQRVRARMLFNAGIRTPQELVDASVETVRKALFATTSSGRAADKIENGTAIALRKTAKEFLRRVELAQSSNADLVVQAKEQVKAAQQHSKAKKRRTEGVIAAAADAHGPLLAVREVASPVAAVSTLTPAGSSTAHAGSICVHTVSAQSNASETWQQLCLQWAGALAFAWRVVDAPLSRIMVCFSPTEVWDVPVDACADSAVTGERRQFLFRMLAEKPSACWDSLASFAALHRLGLLRMVAVERVVDLQVYAWLGEPDSVPDEPAAFAQRLGVPAVPAGVPRDVALCCNTFRAGQRVFARCDAFPSVELVRLEMQFVSSVARMAAHGIGFSVEAFADTRVKLQRKLVELHERVCVARKCRFDLLSRRDVQRVFGCASDAELGKHSDPTARDVVRYRAMRAMLDEYDGLKRCVDSAGRIRCSFSVTASATGRLTTRSPNLQCVPHSRAVPYTQQPQQPQEPEHEARQRVVDSAINAHTFGDLDESARARICVMSELSVSLRDSFVPESAASVLLSADYTQLELRVIAHLSEDDALLALLREGGDVFCKLGAVVHRKSTNDVTERERAQLKGVVYGLVYGMGARSLAERLGVAVAEAERLSQCFRDAYRKVSKWKETVVQQARERGFVETLGGRRRSFAPLGNDNRAAQAEQMRAMINTVCQGSAADLVKRAMVALHRLMGDDAGCVVLQIHDELLVECPRARVHETAALMRQCMENGEQLYPGFRVPLPVRITVGPSWGQLGAL